MTVERTAGSRRSNPRQTPTSTSTPPGARCSPGSSTATPTCRSPAGAREEYEQKVTGVPYEEIARAGGGIASSARALRETPDETVLAQAQELAGEMLRSGTTTFECKSGYGLSTDGELRALQLATELGEHRLPDRRPGRRCSRTPSRTGYTTDTWMDEVEAMLPEALEHASALDIFVESIAFGLDDLDRMGALASSKRRAPARPRRAVHDDALRAGGARGTTPARSTTSRRIHPDDIAPARRLRDAPPCCCPAPSSWAPSATAPARDLIDAGAIMVLATDANPGTSPIFSLPLIIGLGRPPLRLEHTRGAARGHAQRRVGPRSVSTSSDRSSSTSAPTWCCSTARSSTSRTASAATRSRRRSWAASPRTCARTRRGGSWSGELRIRHAERTFPLGAGRNARATRAGPPSGARRPARAASRCRGCPALDGWLVTRYDLALTVMRDADDVHRRRPALLDGDRSSAPAC